MTFFDGGNLLTTVPVAADGTASYTSSFLTTGAHTITAAYNGNGNYDASNGTTTVEVTSTPTPPPPPELCLLACGGLVSLNIDNSDRTYNNYEIYKINDAHLQHNNGAGAQAPWTSGAASGRTPH